jgi:hypothetical protein
MERGAEGPRPGFSTSDPSRTGARNWRRTVSDVGCFLDVRYETSTRIRLLCDFKNYHKKPPGSEKVSRCSITSGNSAKCRCWSAFPEHADPYRPGDPRRALTDGMRPPGGFHLSKFDTEKGPINFIFFNR